MSWKDIMLNFPYAGQRKSLYNPSTHSNCRHDIHWKSLISSFWVRHTPQKELINAVLYPSRVIRVICWVFFHTVACSKEPKVILVLHSSTALHVILVKRVSAERFRGCCVRRTDGVKSSILHGKQRMRVQIPPRWAERTCEKVCLLNAVL